MVSKKVTSDGNSIPVPQTGCYISPYKTPWTNYLRVSSSILWMQYLLAPWLTEQQMAVMTDKLHLYQDKPAQPTSGNLFEPVAEGTGISGGWKTASGRQQGEDGSVIPRIAVGVAAALPVLLFVRRLLQNRRTQIGFLAKVLAYVMG